jgi:TP901 family phage tail tape measure protein
MSFDAKLGEAYVEINAPLAQLEKDLRKAKKTVASSMKQIGAKMKSAGQMMSLGVTLPIVAMGAGIIKTAANFEKGMNRVRALTGATGDDFAKLRDQAKELGSTTQFSATQAADAMGFLAMAGFNTTQILGAMPGTLQLAAAAQMELADAADIVSNVLTGYQMDVSELSRVNDTLVKTFTRTNVNLSMLGQAMKVVGPLAASIGLEFEEVSAAIGLFGNAGIQGAQAGTHLRNVIGRLAKITPEAQAALDTLGIDNSQLVDSTGNVKSLAEVIRVLGPHANRTKELVQIFGMRSGPMLAALLGQGEEAIVTLTEELRNAGGTAERIADVQMEGAAGAILGLKSAFEGLQLAIADSGLLEWFSSMVHSLTGFIRSLSETSPAVLKFATIIAGLVVTIGPLLIALGYLLQGLATLGPVVAALGVAFKVVVGIIGVVISVFTMLSTPILVVGAAVAGLVLAWQVFGDDIKRIVAEVWAAIQQWFVDTFPGVVAAWDKMISGLKHAWQGFLDWIEPKVRWLSEAMRALKGETTQDIVMSVGPLAEKKGVPAPKAAPSTVAGAVGGVAGGGGEKAVNKEEQLLARLTQAHLQAHDEQIKLVELRRDQQLAALKDMELSEQGLADAKVLINETADKTLRQMREKEAQSEAEFLLARRHEWLGATEQSILLIEERRDAQIQSLKKMELSEEAFQRARTYIWETAAEQIKDIEEEKNKTLLAGLKKLQDQFKSTFEGALTGFFQDLQKGELSFKKFADTILSEIQRIAAQQMSKQITEALFGDGGSSTAGTSGGGLGSLLSGVLGLASSLFGGGGGAAAAKQHGGPVFPGQAYLVGESGPEPFIPKQAGHIIPNAALSGIGGQPVTVNMTIMTPDADSFRKSQAQISNEAAFGIRTAQRRFV